MGWLNGWFPYGILAAEWLLRIGLALHLLGRRRPGVGTLAWLLVVVLVPLVGVFVYLLIGDASLGSRRAKRYERITKGIEAEAFRLLLQRNLVADAVDERVRSIAEFGTAVSGLAPLRGNALTLLPDNDAMLAALEQDIAAATSHVHLLYYIWCDDEAGRRIGAALIAAAKRGVRVRALADGAGSWGFLSSDLCRRMRAAGVDVVEALPVSLWRVPFARIDLRNHRKVAVIDGRIAYCGSQNICDPAYRPRGHPRRAKWIDATARVKGPAAQALEMTFLRDWHMDSDEELPPVEAFLPDVTPGEDAESIVQILPSGPGPTPLAIHQALLTTIYLAREELVMVTPYFVPDDALLEALCAAATRGVEVTLVLPRDSDAPLVAAAARAHYMYMLEAGVRIFEHQDGLLHAKTVSMDRRIALVGSTNMDQRSFFLNLEVTMFVYDDDFASVLRFMQMGYLANSRQVFLDEWRKRSRWAVLRDNAAQLLGPLL